jgi:GNAT superfamily N-acetyltransferase
MVKIKIAKEADINVLALLGRVTWAESHGHYIDDKNNLLNYLNMNFSVSKMKHDISNPKNLFYIVYVDDLPVGYAKLIVNAENVNVVSQNNCRLERIFILDDFIPLKIGQQLLTFLEEKAKALQLDTMWLSVYIKNKRAIRFYERNEFKNVGELNFLVSGKAYENILFSKKIINTEHNSAHK